MDDEKIENANTNENNNQFLQLGDIIQIIAPSNIDVNEKTYLIYYLDTEKIKLLNTKDGTKSILFLNNDGSLKDESITDIKVLLREKVQGFSRQNGLIPGVWIDIYFGGDVPQTITGQISDLEEDMIEIKTFPESSVIYIDFGYKGIPENLPIERIVIRDAPNEFVKSKKEDDVQVIEEGELKQEQPVTIDDSEFIQDDSEFIQEPVELVKEEIKELIISGEEYEQGIGEEELEDIEQLVEVPEEQKRYSIENQNNDLLNDMMSKIPVGKQNNKIISVIQQNIERYNELRKLFSLYDDNDNIIDLRKKGANYKPLAEQTKKLKKYLTWFVPVTKITKKLYLKRDAENEEDIEIPEQQDDNIEVSRLIDDFNEIKKLIEDYKNNQLGLSEDTNEYDYLTGKIDSYYQPFSENSKDILIKKQILDEYHSIVDNDNLNTTVGKVIALGSKEKDIFIDETDKKFFIQKYNLGYKRLHSEKVKDARKGVKVVYNKKQVIPNETMDILSFMVMPEPYINFSKLNLPSSNILTKSHLSKMYIGFWNFLKNNQEVNKIIIDDVNDENMYGKGKSPMYGNYISNYYALDQSLLNNDNTNPEELFEKYLNTIIPKTRMLFHMIRESKIKSSNPSFSINSILLELEPFLVYKNDISYKQYEDMIKYISYNIKQFRQDYLSKKAELKQLVQTRNLKNDFQNVIHELLFNEPSLRNTLYDLYGFSKEDNVFVGESEMIFKMNKCDNMKLLMNIISMVNIDLFEFYQTIKKEDIDEIKKQLESEEKELESEELNTKQCQQRTLSKKYIEMDELEADNDIEVFYDKSFDKTNYDIIKEYEKERSIMPSTEFLQFLKNKLVENIGLSEEEAIYDATTMINGKKRVRNGDYAVLEVVKDTEEEETVDYFYYIRTNNKWVRDTTISPNTVISEFCNISDNCFKLKDKCEPEQLVENRIQQDNLKQMVDEFENKYNEMKSVIISKIENSLKYNMDIMKKIKTIALSQDEKYDAMKIEIANTLKETDAIVQSPYLKLRNSILGQDDLVKKYNDVQRFAQKYCRNALVSNDIDDEDKYWLYCIQTNTKLLPAFILRLANVFNGSSNEDYLNELAIICKQQGKLSDDGDKWVDKHSGFTIKNIELDDSEGYSEEGYKIVTRDIIETKDTNKVGKEDEQSKKSTLVMIENIIDSMSDFMAINLDKVRAFIIKSSLNAIESNDIIVSFPIYKSVMKKKGKVINEKIYTIYRWRQILFIVLAYLFVGIQAHIPKITSKKTFPGCKRSFSGFPLDGDSSEDGLIYISCVANKIKSSIKPWISIKKQKQEQLVTSIKNMLNNHVINKQNVINLLNEKRKYILLEKDSVESIPEEHKLKKWYTFLPPLSDIKNGNIIVQNISKEFSDRFLENITKGRIQQFKDMNVINGKIVHFTMSIIQSINKIVKTENLLLFNKFTDPMIENNCCMETSMKSNTLAYFNSKDSSIMQSNKIIEHLSNILYDTNNITKASILYSPANTKLQYPVLSNEFNEETLYRFFIHYCKFDTNLPVPENLLTICISKPLNYKSNDSIGEKIRKLKEDGQYKFSKSTMYELMNIINNENVVTMNNDNFMNNLTIFGNVIEKIDEINNSEQYMPTTITNALKNIFENANADALDNSKYNELKDNLQNELLTLKNNYMDEILNFIINYSSDSKIGKGRNIRERKKRMFKTFLENIMTMQDPESNVDYIYNMSKDEFNLHKSIFYVKNCIHIISVFPEKILNKISYGRKPTSHWKRELSSKDIDTIYENISKNESSFYEFYNNKTMIPLLKKTIQFNKLVNKLSKITPVFNKDSGYIENNYMNIFDNETAKKLYEFYILFSIKQYINVAIRESENNNIPMIDESERADENIGNLEGQDENLLNLEIDDEIDEIEIVDENTINQLKTNVADLIITFLEDIMTKKNIIDQTHESIKEKMAIIKTNERNRVIKKLDKLKGDRDLSGIQREMKKLQLGEYNPYRKEIREYVKNQEYIEERMLTGETADEVEAYDMSDLPNDDDFGDDRDGDEYY